MASASAAHDDEDDSTLGGFIVPDQDEAEDETAATPEHISVWYMMSKVLELVETHLELHTAVGYEFEEAAKPVLVHALTVGADRCVDTLLRARQADCQAAGRPSRSRSRTRRFGPKSGRPRPGAAAAVSCARSDEAAQRGVDVNRA